MTRKQVRIVPCEHCKGDGWNDRTEPCGACYGAGLVPVVNYTPEMIASIDPWKEIED